MKKILLFIVALVLALTVANGAFGTASSVTVNSRTYVSFGNKNAVIADLTIVAGTYSSGIPLTAAQLGLTKVQSLLANSDDGFLYEYDISNAKLKQFYPTSTADIVVDVTTSHTLIDTDASATGTLLYVYTIDGRNGTFVSDISDGADSAIAWSAGVFAPVAYDDDSGDTINETVGIGQSYAVNMDDLSDVGLTCNNALTGTAIYVPLSDGQYAKISHAASGDTAVYFDVRQRLESATNGDTDYGIASSAITAQVGNTLSTTAEVSDEVTTAVAVANLIVLAIGY